MNSESFFEKLKKGMDIESLPEIDESQDKISSPSGKNGKDEIEKGNKVKRDKKKKAQKKEQENEKQPENSQKEEIGAEKEESKEGEKIQLVVEKVEAKKEKGAFLSQGGEAKNWFEPEGELTIDLFSTEDEMIIQSAIAGVNPQDLDIVIEKDMIIIKGIRKNPSENGAKDYFHQECYWGNFSRKVIVPLDIDAGRAKASIKEGILTIKIPIIRREKRKKIIVEG